MADKLLCSQGSMLLNSQGSDLFPVEVKQCMDDPDIQDVINSVQNQDPFLNVQTDHLEYINLNSQNAGIMEVVAADTVMIPQAPMPSPTCAMLSTENYPGPYDFEVQVSGEGSGKNWLFSYELNKLFINMNTIIHISFKRNSFPSGFYVRAIPVYTETEHFQHPVERCVHHRSSEKKHNHDIDEFLLNHVLRIEHPQTEYDYNETSKRWSVRLLLDSPQAGCDWVNIAFKFLCKNSCLSGMNRRPIEVIFTLEDYNGFVYGRQKFKVRICSCPKRDKMKEEADMTPKDPQAIRPGKRLMCPKEAPASRPTKHRKTGEIHQVPVVDSEYMEALLYLICRLKTKLQIEKRSPTEKENHVLLHYEQELKKLGERAT